MPPAASGQLEQLGYDTRATLALVELGEFENGRADRRVAGAGEAVKELALERCQERAVGGKPVASAAYKANGAFRSGAEFAAARCPASASATSSCCRASAGAVMCQFLRAG